MIRPTRSPQAWFSAASKILAPATVAVRNLSSRNVGKRAACLMLLSAVGCGKSPKSTAAADESSIRAIDAHWFDAAEANDVARTAAYYTPGALLFAPTNPYTPTTPAASNPGQPC